MNSKRRLFYAVLNMGLGHASRSLPIIQHLRNQGWELFLGSSGRSLQFLRYEIPQAHFLELPDYGLQYSNRGVSILLLTRQLPALFKKIAAEQEFTNQLVKEKSIDLIISDHRYGCYHPDVPSCFLSHQIRFIAPGIFRPLEFIGRSFNQFYHKNYSAVIVPDQKENGEGLFSGRLSRGGTDIPLYYGGILSSIKKQRVLEDIDIFVSISGPEPQRTVFEKKVLAQITEIPGNKVVVLGKPEDARQEVVSDNLLICHYASRQEMQELMNRSRLIVSRSGYSTLMEIVELQKKALFIPTPGQTEQVYLAERMKKAGCFYFEHQKHMNLVKQIPIAQGYPGATSSLRTADSLRTIDRILSDTNLYHQE